MVAGRRRFSPIFLSSAVTRSASCSAGSRLTIGQVQGLSTSGDRSIEVAPLPAGPDVGFVHSPGPSLPVGYLPVPPGVLVQLRGVFLYPAAGCGVTDWHAPLGHHFFEVAVVYGVAAVPPHGPQDDFSRELPTRGDAHGPDYFTLMPSKSPVCNSTIATLEYRSGGHHNAFTSMYRIGDSTSK